MKEELKLIRKIYEEIQEVKKLVLANNVQVVKEEIKIVEERNDKRFNQLTDDVNKIEKKKVKVTLNEYDKIILKDLESRISILEEESQPYEIN